jgi:hypothetical protein
MSDITYFQNIFFLQLPLVRNAKKRHENNPKKEVHMHVLYVYFVGSGVLPDTRGFRPPPPRGGEHALRCLGHRL